MRPGLRARSGRGSLIYGVCAHLCSAGLDKTSVCICHWNRGAGAPRGREAAREGFLVQCSNETEKETRPN